MCRYGIHPSKQHHACFTCRRVWRDSTRYIGFFGNHVCPACKSPLIAMGMDFKAPRQSDVKQWKKVELLAKGGVLYHSCGCTGPGYRPATLREVPAFLAKRQTPDPLARFPKQRAKKIGAL